MGAWGTAAWENDTAADWFARFFNGVNLNDRVAAAFADEDSNDRDDVI